MEIKRTIHNTINTLEALVASAASLQCLFFALGQFNDYLSANHSAYSAVKDSPTLLVGGLFIAEAALFAKIAYERYTREYSPISK